eukprot:tig00020539_g10428.t1
MGGGRVIHIKSQQEFEAHTTNGTKPAVIDFTATWCGPCQRIGPVFVRFSEEAQFADVVFLKVDVDECAELAQAQGVSCMPTFHFWKGGKKVDEFSGAQRFQNEH